MQSEELVSVLRSGALLIGSSRTEGASDLKNVLITRLTLYNKSLGVDTPEFGDDSLEALQLKTAQEALFVVEKAQQLLARNGQIPEDGEPQTKTQEDMIGTRDLAQIRTLLAIVFNWAIQPLLTHVMAAIPTVSPGGRKRTDVNIIDLTTVPDDYKLLSGMILRLVTIILPRGQNVPPILSLITNVMLDRHLPDLLRPCIVLGWLPKSSASESVIPMDELRPQVVHLINMIPVAQSITALSALLADSSSLAYVRKSCSYLLSRQLLRPEGVRGMLTALFSEEDLSGDDAPLGKLENVSTLLRSLPVGITDSYYFTNIVSQLLAILSSDYSSTPSTHRRAAAFSVSRLLAAEGNPHHATVSRILLPTLQRPLLEVAPASPLAGDTPSPMRRMLVLQVVRVLETLLTNTDPSPILISGLLTPIVPSLYSLLSKLEKIKVSDRALKTTVRGLLSTWGRLVETAEGTATIWLVLDGEGGEWQVDVAGEVVRVEPHEEDATRLSLFTPEDLQRAEESGELDVDANILDLRPDPIQYVAFLKSLERSDVVSEIFMRLLEAYRETKTDRNSDPMKTLLYLQIIMKLQTQSETNDSSFSILKQPSHILSFVKQALDSTRERQKAPPKPRRDPMAGLSLADLRIVEDDEENFDDSGDSDDEDDGLDSEEEMTSTSLNLLLSVLEAYPELSAQTAPILDDIFTELEYLAKEGPEAIKALAREARMVLIARLASSSIPKPKENSTEETPEKKYQKALKLLQDPLLPVRAHGLLLLRELVTATKSASGSVQKPAIDPALVPGILSIFMQSLQDDDSYIFLNAVQGLAAMVDCFGKDALRGLIDTYSKRLDGIAGSSMTQQDIDIRTRVGEALGQVIRRCGDALPDYADILIPPLFSVLRSAHLPATLRTSAISLLALSVNTSPLSVLPYATDLTVAMVDLLQVETVPVRPYPKTSNLEEVAGEEPKEFKIDSTEFKATTTSSKIPPLRRAALHLITLLLRAYAAQVEQDSVKAIYVLPPEVLKRARTTAGYVSVTDEDSIVRVMAREVVEELDNSAEAMLAL